MERIEAVVTMKGIFKFRVPSFGGYSTEDRYIYNMVAEDGTVYVWKTGTFLCIKVLDEVSGWDIDSKGRKWAHHAINRNDVIRIKASVKGVGEYKGEPQTELTRVTVVERIVKAKTEEELAEERAAERAQRRQAQIESLKGADFLWTIPYRQYKEHYADCETLIGSYDKRNYTPAEITVIIREGRLKPSGVRGMHFHGYEFYYMEDGKKFRACYRAISEENALRRLMKECPNATDIVPGKIYDYGT